MNSHMDTFIKWSVPFYKGKKVFSYLSINQCALSVIKKSIFQCSPNCKFDNTTTVY